MINKPLFFIFISFIAVLATLLPLASKGGEGVRVSVLIEFIPFSSMSMIAPLLYPISFLFLGLSILDTLKKIKDPALWYMLICTAGLLVSAISIVEAISHIALFGAICSSVPELNTATGATSPSIGGYLLLGTFTTGLAHGLLRNIAPHKQHELKKT